MFGQFMKKNYTVNADIIGDTICDVSNMPRPIKLHLINSTDI